MALSRTLKWIFFLATGGAVALGTAMITGFGGSLLLTLQADWVLILLILAAFFSMISFGSAIALENARRPGLMQIGLVATLLAFIGCLVILFYGFRFSPMMLTIFTRIVGTLAVGAAWCGVLGVLIRQRVRSKLFRSCRVLTMLLSSGFGIMLGYTIWSDAVALPIYDDPMFLNLVGGLILTLLGLSISLFIKRYWEAEGLEAIDEIIRRPFRAICPRCESQQSLQTGGAACASCGLKIGVKIP